MGLVSGRNNQKLKSIAVKIEILSPFYYGCREGGDEVKQWPFLPKGKQYLITRNGNVFSVLGISSDMLCDH